MPKYLLRFVTKFLKSIWLFPVLILIILISLSFLKINGSSVGIYAVHFFGQEHKDSSLLFGHPRSIRSDEWAVTTQYTIAQSKNNYSMVNDKLGTGYDSSLILDVPYKEWSILFKPHNIIFLVLPLENAFAFKWWFMGGALILSSYFFVLQILPRKRLFAALISISLFFSPFVQWWYQYSTLGSIYYSLFTATLLLLLLKSKDVRLKLLYAVLITYTLVCFALILYPPFQITCLTVLGLFGTGAILNKIKTHTFNSVRLDVMLLAAALIFTLTCLAVFVIPRSESIKTITNTYYPGKRIVSSGGYNIFHLASGHLSLQQQNDIRAEKYKIPNSDIQNQSEASNFIYFGILLSLPLIFGFIGKSKKKIIINYEVAGILLAIFLLTSWLLIPHLTILGNITLLNKVPLDRAIIGLGLASFMILPYLIRYISSQKEIIISKRYITAYSFAIFLIFLLLGIYAYLKYPGYVGLIKVVILSLPIPLAIYLALNKKITYSLLIVTFFSILSSGLVNPFYVGFGPLTKNALWDEIEKMKQERPSVVWAVEDSYLQSYAFVNGAKSITGVYPYPQLKLWYAIDNGKSINVYNRYAHANINIDRNPTSIAPTQVLLTTPDHIALLTEPCSSFIENISLHYIVTTGEFDNSASCTHLLKTVDVGLRKYFVYSVN